MPTAFPPHSPALLPIVGSDLAFPVRRVYCVGRNYAAHAREMGSDPNREPPFFFSKPGDADAVIAVAAGQTGDIAYPSVTQDLHHEIELVVAIGTAGRDIPVGQAAAHIYGYAVGLDLTAVGIAPVDLVRVQRQGDRRSGVLQQAADRGAGRGNGGIPVGGGSLDPGQQRQIGLARGGRVVGDMEAEEGQARPRAGVQPQRPGLDRGAGDLMLQPCAGQVPGLDPPGRPEPRPHHLQRIRGEGRRAVEAIVGRRAIYTTWEGDRMEGVIEAPMRMSGGFPIIRFADGRWGRCDQRVEIVNN